METLIEWLTENWGTIAQVVAYLIAIAAVIAKATPNQTDNKIVYYILHIADLVGFNTEPTVLKDMKNIL